MSDQHKVWTVESGAYSDYTVHGVFSSRDAAELVIGYFDRHDFEIVERTLDPNVPERRAGATPWRITMAADGTVETCEQINPDGRHYRDALFEGLEWWKRPKPRYDMDAVTGTVWATGREHAVKIANDFRVRHLVGSTD